MRDLIGDWAADEWPLHLEDELRAQPKPTPVTMEDALLHTDDQPFCNDPDCPCHSDEALFDTHIGRPVLEGRLTIWDAQALFWPELAESEH